MIIAIDFDNTLCINSFPHLGKPRMWLINKAIEWKKYGHKLILWTCREDIPYGIDACFSPRNYLTEAVYFCKELGLEFDAVNQSIEEVKYPSAKWARKIFADVYIDDKSAIFDEINQKIIVNNFLCGAGVLN